LVANAGLKHARRIKVRAYDRAGEILNSIPPAKNQHQSASVGHDTGKMNAARQAGLSKRQALNAIRIHRVPREDLEEQVESDNPPTIERLAQKGTKSKPQPDILRGRDPADFKQATRLLGVASESLRATKTIDVKSANRGMSDREAAEFLSDASELISWLEQAIAVVELNAGRRIRLTA
jgi:hypothetical protein